MNNISVNTVYEQAQDQVIKYQINYNLIDKLKTLFDKWDEKDNRSPEEC